LNDGGIFIVSYVNFGHRDRSIYWPYSNVQPLNDFRQGLTKYFEIKRSFPTAHNWHHSAPNRKFIRAANMYINMNVPFISPVLGVQYFFICSKLSFRAEISPVELILQPDFVTCGEGYWTRNGHRLMIMVCDDS
jgi:hypothetical protein